VVVFQKLRTPELPGIRFVAMRLSGIFALAEITLRRHGMKQEAVQLAKCRHLYYADTSKDAQSRS
jgi:hypothetical protein